MYGTQSRIDLALEYQAQIPILRPSIHARRANLTVKFQDIYGFMVEGNVDDVNVLNEVREKVRQQGRVWWALEASKGANWYLQTHVSSTLKASLRFSALANAITLKNLIRKGIPAVLRPKVWFSLAGAAKKKSTVPESYYNDLIKAVESKITPATRQIDQFICEDVEDCKEKTWSWRISCSDFRTILAEDTAACSIRVEMLFICYQRDGHILAHILAATSIGVISATAFHYYHRQKPQKQLEDQTVVPLLDRNESGRVAKLERFSNYVARQIGFEDGSEYPQLCKLAYEYLKKSKECESTIYEYFADEPNVDELYVKLVEEFARCILAYFAFHWSQASLMISQIYVYGLHSVQVVARVDGANTRSRLHRCTSPSGQPLNGKYFVFNLAFVIKAFLFGLCSEFAWLF